MAKTGTIYKSAATGKIVSLKEAKAHPRTTFSEKVKLGPTKKRKS